MKLMAITIMILVAAAIGMGQESASRTATIKLYYPDGGVETISLPDNGEDVKSWRYSVSNGCIRFGEVGEPRNWTTFCGTFKVTISKK